MDIYTPGLSQREAGRPQSSVVDEALSLIGLSASRDGAVSIKIPVTVDSTLAACLKLYLHSY